MILDISLQTYDEPNARATLVSQELFDRGPSSRSKPTAVPLSSLRHFLPTTEHSNLTAESCVGKTIAAWCRKMHSIVNRHCGRGTTRRWWPLPEHHSNDPEVTESSDKSLNWSQSAGPKVQRRESSAESAAGEVSFLKDELGRSCTTFPPTS